MSNTHDNITSLFSDIANSIRFKTGSKDPIMADKFPLAIRNIPQEGGSEELDHYVKFLDYDGNVVETWNSKDVQNKTALPSNPSHEGLIAQGWNYSLQEIKNYIEIYFQSDLYVGQMYETASGLTEMYITVTKVTGLDVVCNMVGNKDWGDGTQDNLNSHSYNDYGDYVITCDGDKIPTGTSSEGGLFGSKSLSSNVNKYWCTKLCIGNNVTDIGSYAFYYCLSLTSITIPKEVTSIGNGAFLDCMSLTSITISQGVTSIRKEVF